MKKLTTEEIQVLYPNCTIAPEANIHLGAKIGKGTIISGNSNIFSTVEIGRKCMIRGANLHRNVKVGNNCIFEKGVGLLTDSILGNNVTIGYGSTIKNNVTIHNHVTIANCVTVGKNTIINDDVHHRGGNIGAYCIIASGSTICKDADIVADTYVQGHIPKGLELVSHTMIINTYAGKPPMYDENKQILNFIMTGIISDDVLYYSTLGSSKHKPVAIMLTEEKINHADVHITLRHRLLIEWYNNIVPEDKQITIN